MAEHFEDPPAGKPRRVLVVSGAASWDYRFLVSLLNRAEDIQGDARLLDGDERERLPAMYSQLVAYDAIILIDPPPPGAILGAPSTDWLALLDRFVRRRGGRLIYSAGPKNSPRLFTSKKAAPLIALLPVNSGPAPRKPAPGKTDSRLTEAGRRHLLTRLIDQPAQNRRLWEQVHSVSWCLPIRSAKEKAQILLEMSNKNEEPSAPLLAIHSLGKGSVVYIGFNSLWRLRQTRGKYQQFWRNALVSSSGSK